MVILQFLQFIHNLCHSFCAFMLSVFTAFNCIFTAIIVNYVFYILLAVITSVIKSLQWLQLLPAIKHSEVMYTVDHCSQKQIAVHLLYFHCNLTAHLSSVRFLLTFMPTLLHFVIVLCVQSASLIFALNSTSNDSWSIPVYQLPSRLEITLQAPMPTLWGCNSKGSKENSREYEKSGRKQQFTFNFSTGKRCLLIALFNCNTLN